MGIFHFSEGYGAEPKIVDRYASLSDTHFNNIRNISKVQSGYKLVGSGMYFYTKG